MHASIDGIEYHLPEYTLTTEDLSCMFPEWAVEKIDAKTGVWSRHIAAENECASDLAVAASQKLFDSGVCSPGEIDFVLLCTQSPDYVLPTTACLLQSRLGIPILAGALDFNLGCSGFIYGLGLAEGLIASDQAHSVLLITAETYSKYIAKDDKSSLTIFGDAAAATLISARSGDSASIGPFIYGTDGEGGKHLVVPDSGARRSCGSVDGLPVAGGTNQGISRTESEGHAQRRLVMHGGEIFQFTIDRIPQEVHRLLKMAGLRQDDIDLFVFHQANAYILEELRRILKIPEEKFQVTIKHCANTVSSTIPIALKTAHEERQLPEGARVMLVGFGVGYSWGATIVRWTGLR